MEARQGSPGAHGVGTVDWGEKARPTGSYPWASQRAGQTVEKVHRRAL